MWAWLLASTERAAPCPPGLLPSKDAFKGGHLIIGHDAAVQGGTDDEVLPAGIGFDDGGQSFLIGHAGTGLLQCLPWRIRKVNRDRADDSFQVGMVGQGAAAFGCSVSIGMLI